MKCTSSAVAVLMSISFVMAVAAIFANIPSFFGFNETHWALQMILFETGILIGIAIMSDVSSSLRVEGE